MSTIADRLSIIETDILKRTDLTLMITNQYVNVYRTICNKVPFEELQAGPEVKACTADDPEVDLSTLTHSLAGIVSIQIEYSSTRARRLKRNHVRTYDSIVQQTSREPQSYARWAKKIELFPPPSSAFNLNIRYWKQATISGTASATPLLVPDAWLELLDWETMYRVYAILGRMPEAQALMVGSMQPRMPTSKRVISSDMGLIPRLWNELLLTIQDREGIDEDFSINPVRL